MPRTEMDKNLTKMPKSQKDNEFQRDNRVGATRAFENRKTGVQAQGTSMLKGAMNGKDEGRGMVKN